jgi:hypothetical protein
MLAFLMLTTVVPATASDNGKPDPKDVKVRAWNTGTIVPNIRMDSCDWQDCRYISMILDNNTRAHISYYDKSKGKIMYIFQSGAGTWSVPEVVSETDGTYTTSIALDQNGDPAISFGDGFHSGNLMYTYRDKDGWHKEKVDNGGNRGHFSSLVLNKSGAARISYNAGLSTGNLMYAVRNGTDDWLLEKVDTGISPVTQFGNTGYGSLLKLGSDDITPYISYRDGNTYGSLMYATKASDGSWSHIEIDKGCDYDPGAKICKPDQDSTGNTGYYSSIAFNTERAPVISYYDADKKFLMLATWNPSTMNFDTKIFPDPVQISGNDLGKYSSLAFDTRNANHMYLSYYDATTDSLKYYTNNPADSFDRVASGGLFSTLALDAEGMPHIVYYDATKNEIRYAVVGGTMDLEQDDTHILVSCENLSSCGISEDTVNVWRTTLMGKYVARNGYPKPGFFWGEPSFGNATGTPRSDAAKFPLVTYGMKINPANGVVSQFTGRVASNRDIATIHAQARAWNAGTLDSYLDVQYPFEKNYSAYRQDALPPGPEDATLLWEGVTAISDFPYGMVVAKNDLDQISGNTIWTVYGVQTKHWAVPGSAMSGDSSYGNNQGTVSHTWDGDFADYVTSLHQPMEDHSGWVDILGRYSTPDNKIFNNRYLQSSGTITHNHELPGDPSPHDQHTWIMTFDKPFGSRGEFTPISVVAVNKTGSRPGTNNLMKIKVGSTFSVSHDGPAPGVGPCDDLWLKASLTDTPKPVNPASGAGNEVVPS